MTEKTQTNRGSGRNEEAEKEYREAIRINPDDHAAHYNLGILLKESGRSEEAEKEYQEVVRINARDAGAQPVEDNLRTVSLDTGIGGMPFGREEILTAEQARRKEEALEHFKEAYKAQFATDLDKAASLYQKSIDCYPTAEAHTFLGWTYSFMGMTDEAIDECRRAIEVDPEFGNPYNDIGAYLIEKGDPTGAIPWLECATQARRYQCQFYPHFNLGRVYEARGKPFQALGEYKSAIDLNPGYKLAVRAFRRLQSKLN
jgi:tetratricopeptide (TPR) repeat protein